MSSKISELWPFVVMYRFFVCFACFFHKYSQLVLGLVFVLFVCCLVVSTKAVPEHFLEVNHGLNLILFVFPNKLGSVFLQFSFLCAVVCIFRHNVDSLGHYEFGC